MRDNAVSYQQSIQLESKLRELQAERHIIEQQRNIANREREKVVTESVSLKVGLCACVYFCLLFVFLCVYLLTAITHFNFPHLFSYLIVLLIFLL